jgi:2-phosphosulfolactate phosphatase
MHLGGDATFVATGDCGHAREDVSCAEFIGELLHGNDVDPVPYLRRVGTSAAAADLAQAVERGYPGVQPADVALCLDLDRFSFATVATVATVVDQYLVVVP